MKDSKTSTSQSHMLLKRMNREWGITLVFDEEDEGVIENEMKTNECLGNPSKGSDACVK